MKMTLYTIGCPQCKVLEAKLDHRNFDFEIVTDVEVMKQLGFQQAPMLQVDDKIMNFSQAIEWLKNN